MTLLLLFFAADVDDDVVVVDDDDYVDDDDDSYIFQASVSFDRNIFSNIFIIILSSFTDFPI